MQNQLRIAVLGATGSVGLKIVQALAVKGHYGVNALLRTPGKFSMNSAFVKLFQGDVLVQQDIETAIEGCEAVVVAISLEPLDKITGKLTEATKVIVEAMKSKGVNKLIFVSGTGIIEYEEGKYVFGMSHYPMKYFDVAQDHLSSYNVIKNSGLNYTVMCMPEVIDQEYDGKYSVASEKLVENNKWKISNSNAADFVLQEIKNPQYLNMRVNITNTD